MTDPVDVPTTSSVSNVPEGFVLARIAVSVDSLGNWNAFGHKDLEASMDRDELLEVTEIGMADERVLVWVEALVRKPHANAVFVGTVVDAVP